MSTESFSGFCDNFIADLGFDDFILFDGCDDSQSSNSVPLCADPSLLNFPTTNLEANHTPVEQIGTNLDVPPDADASVDNKDSDSLFGDASDLGVATHTKKDSTLSSGSPIDDATRGASSNPTSHFDSYFNLNALDNKSDTKNFDQNFDFNDSNVNLVDPDFEIDFDVIDSIINYPSPNLVPVDEVNTDHHDSVRTRPPL